jgi:hypothetical protein
MSNVSGYFPSSPASLAAEARRVAEMVEKLPAVSYASDTAPLMQQAGVECFFVYVRSMIEFLGVKPESRDRKASDLARYRGTGTERASRPLVGPTT